MKSNIDKIIKTFTEDTPIEEIIALADEPDDILAILHKYQELRASGIIEPVLSPKQDATNKELLIKVIESCKEAGDCSTAYIQRTFSLSYHTATELRDIVIRVSGQN